MNIYLLLLPEVLISIGASVLILRILATPMTKTLGRICLDEESAGFWLSYTQAMPVIAPLTLVVLMDLFSRYSTPRDGLRMALLATLGGLLAGLIGSRLSRFIAAPEQKEIQQ